ncbi:hypothetical protein P4C99_07640 [Pontiellaceae bacterium B1224]|nr:hypothetical protein [Pontiellaceae bacterium B1224]
MYTERGFKIAPADAWEWNSLEEFSDLLEREHEEWKPALQEFAAWYDKQDFSAIAEFRNALGEWQGELRKQWKEAGLAWDARETSEADFGERRKAIRLKFEKTFEKPTQTKDYERERTLIENEREKIEAKHRPQIEKAKIDRTAVIEAEQLKELRNMLAGYGVKKRGDKWLKELYDFIRDDVCSGNRLNPGIGETALWRVVAEVERLTGADIAERMIESVPFVKGEMFNDAARQNILERVRFIAEFADGKKWLVETVESGSHCGRDAELFELVKPDEQERLIIEKRAEVVRENTARELGLESDDMIYRRTNADGSISRQPHGLHMGRKKDIVSYLLSVGELIEQDGKYVFADGGLNFDSYLRREGKSLGYLKDGEPEGSDYYYNKNDFIQN